MSNVENDVQGMDEDQVLAYTQGKRRKIVEGVMKDNKIPQDRLEATLLIQALDGMDRAALTSKRIKADEKAADAMAGSAAVVANLLTSMGKSKPADDIIDMPAREVPLLGEDIPPPSLVPGETEVAPKQMDFDSFTASFGQSNSNPSEPSELSS